MLIPSISDYNWQVDNWGTTYSNTGIGTSVAASGSTNTKGTDTALLAGIAEDCYFLQIGFAGGDTSLATKRYMADIKIDPAAGAGNAGSSWSVLIANLAANSPNFGVGYGYWYGFPIFLPAGTAIGAAIQSNTASATAMLMVRAFGKPKRPDACRVGSKVQTLGASTGTTVGTAVTPGTAAKGSWSASLGTLSLPSWWFQMGVLSNDTSMLVNSYFFDASIDATSKYLVLRDMPYTSLSTTEQASKAAWGDMLPMFDAPSGVACYARGAAAVAPDSNMSALIYAVQG